MLDLALARPCDSGEDAHIAHMGDDIGDGEKLF